MIVGIGTDIIHNSRILKIEKKFGSIFRRKFLNEIEQKRYHELSAFRQRQFLISCFAAKEAASKSLGTGFRNGIKFQDIVLYHDNIGSPKVKFLNKANSTFIKLGALYADITLSHERDLTIAFVVLSK